MHADVPYWRLSGFYFCYFSTLGSFIPYWSLYLKDTGFNALEIGELTALLVGTKIIAPNIWGWLADYSGKSLRLIRYAAFLAAVVFSGLLFKSGYFWVALITVAFSFFWNATLPQYEAATLYHLKDQAHRYSQIRLWGSVGFIVAVLGVGRFLDDLGISLLPYLITAFLVSIWLLTLITPETSYAVKASHAVSIFKLLKRAEIVAFLLVYMLLQMAHGPYYVFFSIYLHENLYSASLTGLLWALGVSAEIVLFIFMRRILSRLTLRFILLVSIVLSLARWLLIAWGVEDLWILICAQVLHAASFGATHVVAIHLVQQYFGIHHQGKGQALYTSVSFGLGGMLGSLYSGYLWDRIGAQYVFTIAAFCCALAFILAAIWVGKEKQADFA
jgi:PPP family 3-phenylpropionic acid transporter